MHRQRFRLPSILAASLLAPGLVVSFIRAADEPAKAPAGPEGSVSLMRGIVERYTTDRAAVDRDYNIPTSEARRERLDRFYQDQLHKLGAVDFDALDAAGRIDYLLLRTAASFERKQLDHEAKQFSGIADLVPFSKAVVDLEQARRQMRPLDPEQAATTLTEVDAQVARVRKDLEAKLKARGESAGGGVPGKVAANRAARTADDLRETLKHWHDFYDGYDPQFTWWTRQPYPKVDGDLESYARFLREKLAGFAEGEDDPVIGNPIGRDALLDALAAEMIPYTPEELIDIANNEFAWCEAEMERAVRDLGVRDWHAALDWVSKHHVPPGEQPKLIKELADEATKFVEDRDLVTVPALCKEIWRVEMMSPRRQKVNPYFTGGEIISVSYPTDAMAHEDKLMSLRGNNASFCRATVFHELIPGHHLQIFMADRYNTHRRVFRTPFLVEGWALYWEMLLWDKGFPRSAEDRVGMLFWRAHRCARIIFSLKFHLGQMTAPEAIDFLVDRVGHERRNATAEVRRAVAGNYEPLYQAAYMLGGLQIRAMRKELVDSGKMTDKAFHDAILRENAIPVEMIRASLTGQKLARDFKPGWRFYDTGGSRTERGQ